MNLLTAIKIMLFKWITNGSKYYFDDNQMIITLKEGTAIVFTYNEKTDSYEFERFGSKN